jgi:hypothetical protein
VTTLGGDRGLHLAVLGRGSRLPLAIALTNRIRSPVVETTLPADQPPYVSRVLEFGDALPADARAAFTAIHLMGSEGGLITDPERLRALIDDCARTGALRRYPMLLTMVLVMAVILGLDELVDREIGRVRSGSDRWAIACTFVMGAVRWREQADREGSATAMAAALHAFEEAGDRWWMAKMLYGMAQIHAISGERDEAIAAYERAIAMATDLGSHDEVSARLALRRDRTGRSRTRPDGDARPRAAHPGRDDAAPGGPRQDGEPPHRRGRRTRTLAAAPHRPSGAGAHGHPIGRPGSGRPG